MVLVQQKSVLLQKMVLLKENGFSIENLALLHEKMSLLQKKGFTTVRNIFYNKHDFATEKWFYHRYDFITGNGFTIEN